MILGDMASSPFLQHEGAMQAISTRSAHLGGRMCTAALPHCCCQRPARRWGGGKKAQRNHMQRGGFDERAHEEKGWRAVIGRNMGFRLRIPRFHSLPDGGDADGHLPPRHDRPGDNRHDVILDENGR
eukprot:27336_1